MVINMLVSVCKQTYGSLVLHRTTFAGGNPTDAIQIQKTAGNIMSASLEIWKRSES